MDGLRGRQRNSGFDKVKENQKLGGNPNPVSKILSTTMPLVISVSILNVFFVVFYQEPYRELLNISFFTRKLFLYCLSNEYDF